VAKTVKNGREIYWDDKINNWRYVGNDKPVKSNRADSLKLLFL